MSFNNKVMHIFPVPHPQIKTHKTFQKLRSLSGCLRSESAPDQRRNPNDTCKSSVLCHTKGLCYHVCNIEDRDLSDKPYRRQTTYDVTELVNCLRY